MIGTLAFALVIVFQMESGQLLTMNTLHAYSSEQECIIAALESTARSEDRTYLCKPI